MEETLQKILDNISQLAKGQELILDRIDRLEGRLEKSYVKSQRDIIAILERTATKDDVEKILEKIVI